RGTPANLPPVVLQRGPGAGVLQREGQRLDLDRHREVVGGTAAHRVHGVLDRVLAGENDDRSREVVGVDAAEKIEAKMEGALADDDGDVAESEVQGSPDAVDVGEKPRL